MSNSNDLMPSQAINRPHLLSIELACWIALLAIVSLYFSWIFFIGSERFAFSYGTETDTIGSFIPEAQRLLSGQPLKSDFHPPLYPILLAISHSMFQDWLQAGLYLSAASGLMALLAAFWLFKTLYGPQYGLGAASGMMAAPQFLTLSASATSDVVFLAVFLGACSFMAFACVHRQIYAVFFSGILIGIGLILRTNGVSLLALLFMPLIMRAEIRFRIRFISLMAAGLIIVLAGIFCFSLLTGSSLFPAGTVDNLAMTFYAERNTDDWAGTIEQVRGQFDSLFSVLLHDPVRAAKVYISDLRTLALSGLPKLFTSPLSLCFLPGLIWLVLAQGGRMATFIFAIFVLQLLLLNLKFFEARFFLFMTAFLGAGFVASLQLMRLANGQRSKLLISIVGLAIFGLSLAQAFQAGERNIRFGEYEISRVISSKVFERVPENSAIMARKPHIAFYIGGRHYTLPNVPDLEELRKYVTELPEEQSILLFFGDSEASKRPQLGDLRSPSNAPGWLEPVGRSNPGEGNWTLYLVRTDPVAE